MDAHVFRRFCNECVPLLDGALVEKIQQPAPAFCTITVFCASKKRQLCLRCSRKDPFIFITTTRITANQPPSAQIMRLRKYAVGSRLLACVPQHWQRRLWFLLRPPDDAPPAGTLAWLLLDLRDGPSLHFLPQDQPPQEEAPLWPEPEQLAQALEQWRDWPVLTPALRRTLALLDEREGWALLQDLHSGTGDIFAYRDDSGVTAVSAWPLPLPLRGQWREESDELALPLLEQAGQDMALKRLAVEQAGAAAQPMAREIRRLARLLQKLDEEGRRLEGMCQRKADALALQANLWRWPADHRAAMLELEDAATGGSRSIALDPRLDVRQNMARLFHTAARGQRGLTHLQERRRSLEAQVQALEQARQAALAGVAPLPAQAGNALAAGGMAGLSALPAGVQAFVSSDGLTLLRGRSAKGNLAVRKLAAPHDIWLHADNGPGAHVIIRRAHAGQAVPERTLVEAGGLAACKSWQRDAAKALVVYAEVRHIRPLRGAAVGTVRIDKVFTSREVPVDHSLESRLAPDFSAKTGPDAVPAPNGGDGSAA